MKPRPRARRAHPSRIAATAGALGLALALTVGVAAPFVPGSAVVSASTATAVDVTIAETIPGTTGSLASGSIPGCPAPVVTTENATAGGSGATHVFRGDKRFDCGAGDSFTLRFVAVVAGCAPSDVGAWRAVAGTGAFAGVRGAGLLAGRYTAAGAPADACTSDGILDRYVGRLVV